MKLSLSGSPVLVRPKKAADPSGIGGSAMYQVFDSENT